MCSVTNHGYDHVLDINYLQRNAARRHRWYGYADVFAALGLTENPGRISAAVCPGGRKGVSTKTGESWP